MDWEEKHTVVKFNGMLPSSPGAPKGAFEFIAKEGGVRVLGLHEVVSIR